MPEPRTRPGKMDKNVQNGSPDLPAPLGGADEGQDLGSRLRSLVGGDLTAFEPTEQQLGDWNEAFTHTTHARFEHRTLVGIAIGRMRPKHGSITAFNERMAERLGRSTRWVRDTASVASTIHDAVVQGVHLPLELREVYWRAVPSAVENVRQGRHLRWTPPKHTAPPTQEELEKEAEKALAKLLKSLEAMRDPQRQQAIIAQAQAALEGVEAPEDAPAPNPEPPTPPGSGGPEEPGEGEDSPTPGRRPRGGGPGRRGGGGRGRRRR